MLVETVFLHNHGTAFWECWQMVLNTVLNLAIAWQMQQLIDIAAGNGAFLTMAQLCAVFSPSLYIDGGWIMALNAYARPIF